MILRTRRRQVAIMKVHLTNKMSKHLLCLPCRVQLAVACFVFGQDDDEEVLCCALSLGIDEGRRSRI